MYRIPCTATDRATGSERQQGGCAPFIFKKSGLPSAVHALLLQGKLCASLKIENMRALDTYIAVASVPCFSAIDPTTLLADHRDTTVCGRESCHRGNAGTRQQKRARI